MNVRHSITEGVLKLWYRKNILTTLLMPLALLYQVIIFIRRIYYTQIKKPKYFPVPVIVVGNITVGGTGKTPFTAWLVDFLKSEGFHPGIVMRGYGSNLSLNETKSVDINSDPQSVGDEALLLANKTQCPIVIGRDRTKAVQNLLDQFPNTNIIVSDDGLQHYALGRDLEIVIIDGQRRFGNNLCLPAGPLREPPRRLKKVDFVLSNGPALLGEWAMESRLSAEIYAVNNHQLTHPLCDLKGKTVHAVAAIGNPKRFFDMLKSQGINIIEHRFCDHHVFNQEDVIFKDDNPILITEKDAVKCVGFTVKNTWVVPLEINLSPEFVKCLKVRIHHGQKTARYSRVPNLQAASSLQEGE